MGKDEVFLPLSQQYSKDMSPRLGTGNTAQNILSQVNMALTVLGMKTDLTTLL